MDPFFIIVKVVVELKLVLDLLLGLRKVIRLLQGANAVYGNVRHVELWSNPIAVYSIINIGLRELRPARHLIDYTM
jgi:hypothetical protein